MQSLPGQRFSVGNVDIRLNPPASRQLPTSFCNALAYLRNHSRVAFSHPFVELGGGFCKGKLRVALHAVERRTKGAEHY